MKLVYSSPDKLLVSHVRNLLEAEGIDCVMKNEYLVGAAGELPLNEIWPEVWVENSRDSQRAELLIKSFLSEDEEHKQSWLCEQCGEEIDGNFAACWQCGHIRGSDD